MMKLYEGEMVENYLMEQDIKKPNCLIFQIGKKEAPKHLKFILDYFNYVPNVWPMWDELYENIAKYSSQDIAKIKLNIQELIDNEYIYLIPDFIDDDLII